MVDERVRSQWETALPDGAGEATLEQVQALLQEADRRHKMLQIKHSGQQVFFVQHSYLRNLDTVLLWCSKETFEASMVMVELTHMSRGD